MTILPTKINPPPPVSFNPRRVHHWLAFGAGSGLLPKAPGTWGTLAAIPLYLGFAQLTLPLYGLMLFTLFGVGIWACHRVEQELGIHDHPAVVWDEIVGYLITLTASPPGFTEICIGFILFRFFDILKPWPIRWFDQHIHGGLGVMLDDLIAGLFAWIVLQLARVFI